MSLKSDPFRIFPHATTDERAQLQLSIEAVGLRHPVVIDDSANVIDGHERRDACIELGFDWLAGADVRIGMSEIQKKSLAIELNLWRRPIHLTRRQRNELLDIYLIANPHLSEHRVADLFSVNQSTVHRRRRALMQTHQLEPVATTVGKDGVARRIGVRKKKDARLIVKSQTEYQTLLPSLKTVGCELTGLIRRPKRIHGLAERKLSLDVVNRAPPKQLPTNVRIEHCDFRDLCIEPESVDVILTDVVWSFDSEQDWVDLAALSTRWLKKDGVFCSIIGTGALPLLCRALSQHLHYQWTICLVFREGYRSWSSGVVEKWRPAVLFSRSKRSTRIDGLIDAFFETRSEEKQFHDWQQPIEVCTALAERLTRTGDVVLDPHLGTGTNAVACSLLGGRSFIGCDIDEQQIRTARYRIATEGSEHGAETENANP